MKKTIFILALIVAGCNGKAVSSEKKADFDLELLFEKDGCKMYRFTDGFNCVYWSDCSGQTQYNYRQNKTTRTLQQITNE